MSFDDEDAHLLAEIGFTENQGKLYLALLRLGKAGGKIISKQTGISRPVVYRTLNELQKMGLVEREITFPLKFIATPLKQGLQIFMTQKLQQYEKNREKAERFLLKKRNYPEVNLDREECSFKIIEGKEKIIQIIKLQHHKAKRNAIIISTLGRWMQIINCCFEDYEEALQRKVKYQIVVEKPENKAVFPEQIQVLLEKPNFELKTLCCGALQNNFGVFDDEEATFNFFPSKSLKESPIIWTNHLGFISMAHDQFEKVWKKARKYKPQ
jgi:sugar-specific transcriptional regulator TrmB